MMKYWSLACTHKGKIDQFFTYLYNGTYLVVCVGGELHGVK